MAVNMHNLYLTSYNCDLNTLRETSLMGCTSSQTWTNLYVNYARIKLRVTNFVKLRRPENGMQKTPREKGVKKLHDYLKEKDLLVVPFDKGRGFSVMKMSIYREKLDDVPNSDQFQKTNGGKDEIAIKNVNQINNSLQQLMKQEKISGQNLPKTSRVNRFRTNEVL